jgi:hypothetical protein
MVDEERERERERENVFFEKVKRHPSNIYNIKVSCGFHGHNNCTCSTLVSTSGEIATLVQPRYKHILGVEYKLVQVRFSPSHYQHHPHRQKSMLTHTLQARVRMCLLCWFLRILFLKKEFRRRVPVTYTFPSIQSNEFFR